jgi:carboxysome shell carbonic anhydrase
MINRPEQDGFGPGGRGSEPWNRRPGFGQASWTSSSPPGLPPECGRHRLGDRFVGAALRHRADEIGAAFSAIEPVLRKLAHDQFEEGFVRRATAQVLSQLHLDVSADLFAADCTTPLNLAALHARCVLDTFCRFAERASERSLDQFNDGESLDELVRCWGFHAIDITPCADGRLSGVVDHILRIPPSIITSRRAYASGLFDIEASVRQWESTELRRWRQADPNAADAPTRYLKICVYHFSNADASYQHCSTYGSDAARAAAALLERLRQFATAIRLLHGEAALVATLLVGVNTDTDAIRVHVPDADGTMHVGRHLNSHILYNSTTFHERDAAKEAIRRAVAACAGVSAEDASSTGMRWFCGYLLKNNIAQLNAVREWHGGRPRNDSQSERLIVAGDMVDDLLLRSFAFQAQMETVEEGAADLDIGIATLRPLAESRRLAIPLLVHLQADPRIPGSAQRTQCRARRLAGAIQQRYADLTARGLLHIQAVIRDGADGALLPVDLAPMIARTKETYW